MFKTNVGGADRAIRVILGIVLIAAYFLTTGSGVWHQLLLLGVIPLVTGLLSTCPLYSILGISTCPMRR